jgi:hypothetical protein
MDLGEPSDGVSPLGVLILHEIGPGRADPRVDIRPAPTLSVSARTMAHIIPREGSEGYFPNRGAPFRLRDGGVGR